MVEAALIFPVLFAILLGLFTGAAAWNRHFAMGHVARQASRYAVTLPTSEFSSLDQWLTNVSQRASDLAGATLGASVPGRSICVAYVYPNGTAGSLDTTRRRLQTGTASPVYANAACYSDGLGNDDRRVQIVLQRDDQVNTLFVTRNVTLKAQIDAIFEAVG